MFSTKSDCPVPFNQQPLNEYLALKESFLFAWSVSSQRSFTFGFLYLAIFLFIFFSIFISLFTNLHSFLQFVLSDLFVVNLVLFILFIRLYLGWSYIIKRLMSATIFYEESGWYDGQVWIKTSDYLTQDRLIGLYQVMPFILRIKYIFFITWLNFFVIYLFNYIF
uniref:Ycf36 n=1 Tax=Dipterosiphonia australica TaxID=2007208 RepID=A0A1Z1ML72_9FLOR|nr:hypothetical protein [Dipterosiphonia australica]ARW66850.1 hypothetical protein [Dipterosiphonia australica]